VGFVVGLVSACSSTGGTESGSGGRPGSGGEAQSSSSAGRGSVDEGGSATGGTSGGSNGKAGGAGSNGEPECALFRFKAEGFTLNVLGTGELASLEISSADFQQLSEAKTPLISHFLGDVGQYFKDEFFWHMYVLREHASSNELLGQNRDVRRPASGLNLIDPSLNELKSKTKLTAFVFLRDDLLLGGGVTLHEMMHTWGQMIVPELGDQHWDPLSDVNGFLGGYPRGGIKDLGDGSFDVSYGGFDDVLVAADIEMYMAGLWPKEKVQPFHWVRNSVYLNDTPDNAHAIFSGDELVTVTIDDVIAQYGPRVPDASASIHDFRLLPIVVTDVPLTQGDWDLYRWQLAAFQAQTPVPQYDYTHASLFAPPNLRRESAAAVWQNFRISTHGVGTLKTDGLVDTLESRGECVASLPDSAGACTRLAARAASCGIAAGTCTVDREFTNADGKCIADCADQTSCGDLTAAAAGIEAPQGNFIGNAFTWCSYLCQCKVERGCSQ